MPPTNDAPANAPICLRPLDLFPGDRAVLSDWAAAQWLWAMLLLGVVLRVTRYLLRFPLWEDEAMLSVNLINRGYHEILRPLSYGQIAPPLFLWGQVAIVRLLGFHEYALRLIPFLGGLASMFLFRHTAGRLLKGLPLLLAVGLFAVSYPMTRYAAEAKPYGCDLFVALAMLALAVEWLRRPDQTRWLWCLAAIVGPAVGYSFPSLFVAGGISLVIGWHIASRLGQANRTTWWAIGRRSTRFAPTHHGPATLSHPTVRRRPALLAWLAFNAILLAAFGLLMSVSQSAAGASNQQRMVDVHWADFFRPLAAPLKLLPWLLSTHAGAMLGYPVGGPNYGSTASLIFVALGIAVLLRRRELRFATLLLAPLGLNFLAACLHKFPYGGHARMTLFLAPAFCILLALGLTAIVAWIAARRKTPISFRRGNPALIAIGLLVLLGGGSWFRDVSHPYKSATTLRAREFAQWFWFELAQDGELVSCETDLDMNMSPVKPTCGWSSLYYCNQRIYSPRHARGERPQWSKVSAERPLRCVLYRSPIEERESPPVDPATRERWLAGIQTERNLELVAYDTYPFAAYDKSDGLKKSDDYIEVFKFVPKAEHEIAAKGMTER